ncbi:MAG TPA: adenylate/guanylate cyclase domain-containing protein, partial [Gammaproteobacteria bacterium]|nr:adenylate/guanylate cyclase domain-containing protein [Gammaproteobacteria bacterium]
MFCDLVESTALSHQIDPEDLRDVIRLFQSTCAAVIERYDGYVSRFMGDGILVLFGYPSAHENDAERAVHAALEITKSVSALKAPYDSNLSLAVRTGIATGLVVAGDVIGEGSSEEEAIVGSTPNLAARLQSLAEPNTVVISEETRRLLFETFEYRSLGERKLKGFHAPVVAWRVIGPSAVETRFDAAHNVALTPWVNRNDEIEFMRRLWDHAKSKPGQALLVCGEAGIGKSRLAKALREQVASEPHAHLQYQCSPYYRYTALYPFTRQLERAAGFERDDSDALKLEKLRTVLDEASLPLFAHLISIPTERDEEITRLSPKRRKELVFDAILGHLIGRARQLPVLATIEDVHWMDPTSLELMTFIIDRIAEASALFILTFRPEFSPTWSDKPNVSMLKLNGLHREYGERLAESVFGDRHPAKEIIYQVVDKTEGVPLFIEELAKSLLESGALRKNGTPRARGMTALSGTIPATLMDSLMARVDQLGDAKSTAQIGAVIGQDFTHSLISMIASLPEDELQAHLDRLISSGLAIRRFTGAEARYAFKHALIRDAAYNSLLRKRREILHAQIAECLESRFPETSANEPELLAYHYSRTGLTEKAIRYWQLAGERASTRSANLEALSHVTNALDLLEHLPDTPVRRALELSLLITLGPVQIAIKGSGSQDAKEVYARAVELCAELPDSALHFAAYWGQWRTSRSYLTKRERADRLLAVADNLGDPGLQLQAHHCQWASLFNLGFHRQCLRHVERGVEIYQSGDFTHHAPVYGGHDPAVCGQGEAALSLWLMGYPQQALAHMDKAFEVAGALSHAGSTAHAMDIALMLHSFRQDTREVRHRAEQMIALSENEQFAAHRAKGAIFRGWALFGLGEVERSIACMREGIGTLRGIGTSEDLAVFLGMLAQACAAGDKPGEGMAAIEEAFRETE